MIDLSRLSPDQVERFVHLQSLVDRQNAEFELLRRRRDYYDGLQDILLTGRQRDFLGVILESHDVYDPDSVWQRLAAQGSRETFSFNLVRNVVDVIRERLKVDGFLVDGVSAADEKAETTTPEAQLAGLFWRWWSLADLDTLQLDLYRKALRDGVAYMMVTWNEDEDRPDFIIHDQDNGLAGVTTHLDSDTHKPMYFCKYWTTYDPLTPGATGQERKTIYLPGEVRKYIQGGGVYSWQPVRDASDTAWPLVMQGADGAPLGFLMWPFRVPGGSDISPSVLSIQDGLNASVLDLLAAAAANGFPIMSVEFDASVIPPSKAVDAKDEEEPSYEVAPGRVLELYGGRLSRLPASDLGSMIDTIWMLVSAMSAVTGIPQYRLRPMGGSDVPSGEALKQLEAGLVAKAIERQLAFTSPWGGVMRTALRLAQRYGREQLPAVDSRRVIIKPIWTSAETRSDTTQAQVGTAHKAMGVPDEIIWQSVLGYTPEEIAAFKEQQRQDEMVKIAAIAAQLRQAQVTQPATGATP